MTVSKRRQRAAAAAQRRLERRRPPSATDLPPIAAKADDLEAIKKAVEDAAAVGGGLWLSYLFVLFYLAVAAGAVTHADLFFENPVKLPFLNIELPLLGFSLLAPILFLVVHAYALVHLVMLTGKTKRFHEALREQLRAKTGLAETEIKHRTEIQTGLRWQLPSNIFIQFLAGPEPTNFREKAFRWLLWAIAIATLAVAPVFLLLLFQMQFLPFHSSLIVWVQRVVLLLDLGLIWWLWSMVLSTREVDRGGWASWAWARLGVLLGLSAFLFSWATATFPGEWQEAHLPSAKIFSKMDESPVANEAAQSKEQSFGDWIASYLDWALNAERVSLHDWVFKSPVDGTTRRRRLPFSNTLVLTGFNVLEGLGIDDPEKVKARDFVLRARGRDLKGAIFDLAILPKVDFAGAQLEDASLNQTQLQSASLKGAELQSASLKGAELQGASLNGAQLEGASLNGARLEGASLFSAQLQGASLDSARLEGALLFSAQLQGASLSGALLEGASLNAAQLEGARLFGAQLQAASLNAAQLEGATLDAANFEGASLDYANLQGASLQQARLRATSLWMAFLWRTNCADRIPGALKLPAPLDVRLPDAPDHWRPIWRDGQGNVHSWNDEVYHELRHSIESLPAGVPRYQALESIRRADCANADKTLASCDPDPSAEPPPEAAARRKALEDARVDDSAFAKALATELKALACSGGDDAVYALRGLEEFPPLNRRLADAGPEAPALIDFIMSKDCPVSAALTDADKARLLQIKRDAIKEAGQ